MALTQVETSGLSGSGASSNSTTGNVFSQTGPFKNRIINGDMRIDQRNAGASVSLTTPATYVIDRWSFRSNTSINVQRSTTAPTAFTNSAYVTVPTGAASSSGHFNVMAQYVEGFNVSDLAWGSANAKAITLSFQVRSSQTGTFAGSIRNSAGDRSYVFTYSVSSANTWTTVSIGIPGDTSGTWLTDNSIGLSVVFDLGSGSSFATTAGSWTAGNYSTASGAVQLTATTGATFYITGVQLEPGSVATPFERRSYGQELALCQRYYQKSYRPANAPGTPTFEGIEWMNGATARLANTTRFAVQMRTAPGIVPYDYAGTANRVRTSAGDGQTGYVVRGPSENNFTLDYSSGGVTEILYHWTASAEL